MHYCWSKEISISPEKTPVFVSGGIISVPPTRNIVIKLQLFSVANIAPLPPFCVGPISNKILLSSVDVKMVVGG